MIPLESPVPEIGPPGSESGGRKRTHGTRPAARLRKRRISHRGYAPLLATEADIRDRRAWRDVACEGVAGQPWGEAGRGEPDDSFSWRSVSSPRELGAAGRMGYPARAPSADALPCLALRRGPRQMQNEPADRADDLDGLSNRSRSHVTWVRAHAVPAARSRSSCIST